MKVPLSKLPWNIKEINPNWQEYSVFSADGDYVLDNTAYENVAPETKDAEYIVQACNEFPKMIELLVEAHNELTFHTMNDNPVVQQINEFLTKLKENEKGM